MAAPHVYITELVLHETGCKKLLERQDNDTSDATVGRACLLYKEGNYSEAQKLFTTATNSSGYQPALAYNIALCFYQLKQYGPALKQIAEIIEKGVTGHPELGVGAAALDAGVRSVGNSQVVIHACLRMTGCYTLHGHAIWVCGHHCCTDTARIWRACQCSSDVDLFMKHVKMVTRIPNYVLRFVKSFHVHKHWLLQVLKESCLIEAFNLKAAIEYNMKSFAAAREALADAPPRTEEELDPVHLPPLCRLMHAYAKLPPVAFSAFCFQASFWRASKVLHRVTLHEHVFRRHSKSKCQSLSSYSTYVCISDLFLHMPNAHAVSPGQPCRNPQGIRNIDICTESLLDNQS